MAKETSIKSGLVGLDLKSESVSAEVKRENTDSADELRFQKQQDSNLKIKQAMAEELREMELPDHMVNEILNLEDEVPF